MGIPTRTLLKKVTSKVYLALFLPGGGTECGIQAYSVTRQQEALLESPEVGIRQIVTIVTAAESKIQPGSFIEGHADDLFPGGSLKSAEPSKIKSSAESELAALLSPNL